MNANVERDKNASGHPSRIETTYDLMTDDARVPTVLIAS